VAADAPGRQDEVGEDAQHPSDDGSIGEAAEGRIADLWMTALPVDNGLRACPGDR
jgi:hypothetical protein